jgi:hypothetical protein
MLVGQMCAHPVDLSIQSVVRPVQLEDDVLPIGGDAQSGFVADAPVYRTRGLILIQAWSLRRRRKYFWKIRETSCFPAAFEGCTAINRRNRTGGFE